MSRNYKRHGLYHHPLYATWQNMKRRCYDPKNTKYERYGGRGITVCDRWLYNFDLFLEDMGEKPSPRHTIDRIDNDGDYSPNNCRWATFEVQNHNQGISRNNTSGHTGVAPAKRGYWRAYIRTEGRVHSLGQYRNIEDAVKARQNAEAIYVNA